MKPNDNLRDQNSERRFAGAGLTPARSTTLKKKLRELDSQIGKIDSRLFPDEWKFSFQNSLRKEREKLDAQRLKVRNELKYGNDKRKN